MAISDAIQRLCRGLKGLQWPEISAAADLSGWVWRSDAATFVADEEERRAVDAGPDEAP
jgi:hypothetical protein